MRLSCRNTLSIDDVNKKINGFKTQFLNKVSKTRKSETSFSNIYKTSWWCFELPYLLKDSAPIRKNKSNLTIQENSNIDTKA